MERKVDYQVTKVTLFPDRARITCQGTLKVDQGSQTLVFDELPLTMDVDSIRVGGKGAAQIRIMGVEVVRKHYEQSPSERVIELEGQIESLSDKVQVLEDQIAGYQAQAEHLQGMRLETRAYAKGLARGQTSVADQSKLMAFLAEQDEIIRDAQRQVNVEIRALERQIDKLQRELNDLQNVRPRQRYQARIEVESADALEFHPEMSCVVGSAGWQPLYDIRLLEQNGSKRLNLSMIAQVYQRTGQEWTGIQLIVSTARPALNQRLPELRPWFIDEYQPPQPRRLQPRSAIAESTMAAMPAPPANLDRMEMAAMDFPEAELSQAQAQEEGAVVSYLVAGRWDIPSDGSPHKMLLDSTDLNPKLDYVTIPRHTDAVFRRVTVSNESNGPFLPGTAMLFVGEDYIGKTKIDYTPQSSEIELLLGVEDQIKVERELAKREVDKRLLRENRVIRYAYEIRLENLTREIISLEAHDQLPVSKHEQIKVKLDQVQPEPHEKTDLNLLEWNLELQPAEKKSISYEFVVEHPRSMRINGLID